MKLLCPSNFDTKFLAVNNCTNKKAMKYFDNVVQQSFYEKNYKF